MKVLIASDTIIGSTATFIYNIINQVPAESKVVVGLKRKNERQFPIGHQVFTISSTPYGIIDRILSKCYRIYYYKNSKYALPYSSWRKLSRIIRNERIDIVHSNFGTVSLMLLPITKKYKLKLISHFHGYDASELLNRKDYTKNLNELLSYTSKVILVAETMKNSLMPHGLNKEKVEIVPYGIDVDFFKSHRDKLARNKPEVAKILHVGRITAKKGVPDLIRVVLELMNEGHHIQLSIVGGGEEFEIIEDIVESSKHKDKIDLLGYQPPNIVRNIMADHDIFVLNSRTAHNGDQEGYPNVLLEAMASGLCVISTFHAGIPDIIQDKKTGLLVKEYDNEQLKGAIKGVVLSYNLRLKLATAAQSRALKYFSLSKMESRLKSVYAELA